MRVPSPSLRETGPIIWRSILVLALGSLVTLLLFTPARFMPPPVHSVAQENSAVAMPGVEVRELSSLEAVIQRPLFSPSRRPWMPPASTVNTESVGALDTFELVGVVISDSVRRALIRPPDGARTLSLAEGDRLDGWRLNRVDEQAAHFVADGMTFRMRFRKRSVTSP